MPEDLDMILPEGFDPEKGDANFDADGNLLDAPVEAEPTTAEAQTETNEGTTEPVAETEEPTTVPEEASETPVAPTVKVRYNHEDRELSLDEAALLAQKGMNFDKIEAKSRDQEARLNKYDQMAKMFGYENADAMLTQAEENFMESKVKDLVDQGNTEAMARFLVKQEMEKNRPQQTKPIQQGGLTPERKAEIDEFARNYPGVTKIPDEVFALNRKGLNLSAAYGVYQKQIALEQENAKAKTVQNELAILKQNQASAARGPVTGTTGMAAPEKEEPEDPFLKGFENEFNY